MSCDKDSYYDYRCEKYGWSNVLYLKMKIKDDAKLIPSDLRAWGHIEHIYIGGPSTPGFTMSKFPLLCGAQQYDGEDVFIPSQGMAKLF